MRTRSNLITAAMISLMLSASAQGQLPNRPTGKVLDTTGTLSQETINAIEQIGRQVNQATQGDIMVAVLDTTNGKNPRQFATELFNHWQIGNHELNNGVLVFAAMKDRKAEIILGDGIGTPPDFPQAQAIMSDYMIPQFKQGNPEQGVLTAVREAARRYFNIGAGVESLPMGAKAVRARKQTKRKAILKIILSVLGSGGLMGAAYAAWSWYRRRRQRDCSQCSRAMILLGEADDNAHLTSAENMEEEVGSVDYDVWLCQHCDEVLKLRYPAVFSSFATCPRCSCRTSSKTKNTISAATQSSSGTREVVETCQNCHYSLTTLHTIPMIVSSSSSSGGSSFSGGSSSGGGASGSW